MVTFIVGILQITLKCSWYCLSPNVNLTLKDESAVPCICKMCVCVWACAWGLWPQRAFREWELKLSYFNTTSDHLCPLGPIQWIWWHAYLSSKQELGDGCQRYLQLALNVFEMNLSIDLFYIFHSIVLWVLSIRFVVSFLCKLENTRFMGSGINILSSFCFRIYYLFI